LEKALAKRRKALKHKKMTFSRKDEDDIVKREGEMKKTSSQLDKKEAKSFC
jgi:hypothetical protein